MSAHPLHAPQLKENFMANQLVSVSAIKSVPNNREWSMIFSGFSQLLIVCNSEAIWQKLGVVDYYMIRYVHAKFRWNLRPCSFFCAIWHGMTHIHNWQIKHDDRWPLWRSVTRGSGTFLHTRAHKLTELCHDKCETKFPRIASRPAPINIDTPLWQPTCIYTQYTVLKTATWPC